VWRDAGGRRIDLGARSIEGWVIIVTNIHEEAQEDDIHDIFSDYGEIKNMPLDLAWGKNANSSGRLFRQAERQIASGMTAREATLMSLNMKIREVTPHDQSKDGP